MALTLAVWFLHAGGRRQCCTNHDMRLCWAIEVLWVMPGYRDWSMHASFIFATQYTSQLHRSSAVSMTRQESFYHYAGLSVEVHAMVLLSSKRIVSCILEPLHTLPHSLLPARCGLHYNGCCQRSTRPIAVRCVVRMV